MNLFKKYYSSLIVKWI